MTKKIANSGAVHLSALPIMSSEYSLMLQKVIPSIIHTRSEEKDIVTGPALNFTDDSATVSRTKPIVNESLFEFE